MPSARLPHVDIFRGLALWAMFFFHLTWDLANFGWIDPETPYAPGYRWLGHIIAVSFLLLVGVSLVLARRSKGPLWRSRSFWRRWATIAAAAAAISAVSCWMFPATPIFFGILHCIAMASLLALPVLEAPPLAPLTLGVLSLLAPHFLSSTLLDGKMFWWTGLSTLTPASNDFRPLLPWLAFVFFGVALGRVPSFQRAPEEAPVAKQALLGEVRRPNALARALGFCGRHSLVFYLIHQPILFGFFFLLGLLIAPPPDERAFLRACAVNCVNQGADGDLCEKSCACFIEHAKSQGFWVEAATNRMNPRQKAQAHDEAVACYAEAAAK